MHTVSVHTHILSLSLSLSLTHTHTHTHTERERERERERQTTNLVAKRLDAEACVAHNKSGLEEIVNTKSAL